MENFIILRSQTKREYNMKRRLLTVCMVAMMAVSSFAQTDSLSMPTPTSKFGYVSYEQVLRAMPDYALVQQKLQALRTQYDAELQRVTQDFNIKYEEFLQGQRDFPETILRKRQTELKDLLERNLAFKAESREQLKQAEVEAMAPLRQMLNETLEAIGLEQGLAFILNTDAGALPFVHPAMGVDVSERVIQRLTRSVETLRR